MIVTAPAPRQTALWAIAVLLAVIATALVLRLDESVIGRAWAQQVQPLQPSGAGRLGARGIYAFAAQITKSTYGIYMLDVDTGTIWCYELDQGRDGTKQLRLVAARSWIFDRYLEEFNVADPSPAAVAELVEKQAQRRPADDVSDKAPSTRPASDEPGRAMR